ncbi:MAG: hypothetical protein SGILL_007839, partial [Bacillariaceae sp.]
MLMNFVSFRCFNEQNTFKPSKVESAKPGTVSASKAEDYTKAFTFVCCSLQGRLILIRFKSGPATNLSTAKFSLDFRNMLSQDKFLVANLAKINIIMPYNQVVYERTSRENNAPKKTWNGKKDWNIPVAAVFYNGANTGQEQLKKLYEVLKQAFLRTEKKSKWNTLNMVSKFHLYRDAFDQTVVADSTVNICRSADFEVTDSGVSELVQAYYGPVVAPEAFVEGQNYTTDVLYRFYNSEGL